MEIDRKQVILRIKRKRDEKPEETIVLEERPTKARRITDILQSMSLNPTKVTEANKSKKFFRYLGSQSIDQINELQNSHFPSSQNKISFQQEHQEQQEVNNQKTQTQQSQTQQQFLKLQSQIQKQQSQLTQQQISDQHIIQQEIQREKNSRTIIENFCINPQRNFSSCSKNEF